MFKYNLAAQMFKYALAVGYLRMRENCTVGLLSINIYNLSITQQALKKWNLYISHSTVITLLLVTRYFSLGIAKEPAEAKTCLSSTEAMRNMFGLCLPINLHETSWLLWLAAFHRWLAVLCRTQLVCLCCNIQQAWNPPWKCVPIYSKTGCITVRPSGEIHSTDKSARWFVLLWWQSEHDYIVNWERKDVGRMWKCLKLIN